MASLVGLILAQGKSKRLEGKNRLLFKGKPMFLWNVEKCLKIFSRVYVSSDDDWILRLLFVSQPNKEIVVRLGHKDCLTRLTHFVKVFPKIMGDRVGDVDSVDLRYANGMAVRFAQS